MFYPYFYKIEWSSVFQEACFLCSCYSIFPFLVTMLKYYFCLGFSILENMVAQQESVLFTQDHIPLFFFFLFF